MPSMGITAKQSRMTYLDTIMYQKRMIMFIHGKLAGKPYFINRKEQYDFYELLSYCLLSQGTFASIIPIIKVGGRSIPVGKDIHHFCNLMTFNVNSEKVVLVYEGKRIEVPSIEIWKALLNYCLIVFPRAQAEALKMSKEVPKSETRSMGYGFSADKKLDEEKKEGKEE